jgi:hypothetical protein
MVKIIIWAKEAGPAKASLVILFKKKKGKKTQSYLFTPPRMLL